MARAVRVGGALLVVALALVVAGCGGSSSPSSAGTATAPTTTTGSGAQSGTQSAAFQAFQACVAKAGIKTNFGGGRPGSGTPPAGGSRPSGGTPPAGGFGAGRNLTAAQQQALTACRAKLPAGFTPGRGGGRPGGTANPALAKYTTCLKQHGVTLGASTKAATFKKASAACAKYAPRGAAAQ
jgi:hypothetical protein